MTRRTLAALALLFVAACDGKSEDKFAAKQKALEEQRKKLKDDKAKADNPAKSDGPKDPFWDDASLISIRDEGKCPDNLWALFKMPAPGADAAEKKANESKRKEYAETLRNATYVISFRNGTGLSLDEYIASKGYFPLTAKSTIDCKDSVGNVTIALAPAKAQTPPTSAAKEGAGYTMRIWYAEPQSFQLPMESMGAAKEWRQKSSLGLEAKFIFKLGKTAIDKKLEKVAKHVEKAGGETIEIGGGSEDWGAGRVVHADVQAMRITTDRGTKTWVEKR